MNYVQRLFLGLGALTAAAAIACNDDAGPSYTPTEPASPTETPNNPRFSSKSAYIPSGHDFVVEGIHFVNETLRTLYVDRENLQRVNALCKVDEDSDLKLIFEDIDYNSPRIKTGLDSLEVRIGTYSDGTNIEEYSLNLSKELIRARCLSASPDLRERNIAPQLQTIESELENHMRYVTPGTPILSNPPTEATCYIICFPYLNE